MAGFLDRWRMFGSGAEPAPEADEDPRVAVDLAYQRQLELLQRVRRDLSGIGTSLRRIDVAAAQVARQVEALAGSAEQALADGRDDAAREALAHRAELTDRLDGLAEQRATLGSERDGLAALAAELHARIRTFRARKDAIAAGFLAERARARIDRGAGSADGWGRADLADALAFSSRVESELDRIRAELPAGDPSWAPSPVPVQYEQPPSEPPVGPPDPTLR